MRSDWSFGTVAGGGGTLRVGKDGTIGFAEEGEEEEEWDGEDEAGEYGSGLAARGDGESGSEESVQGSTVRGVVSSRSISRLLSVGDDSPHSSVFLSF